MSCGPLEIGPGSVLVFMSQHVWGEILRDCNFLPCPTFTILYQLYCVVTESTDVQVNPPSHTIEVRVTSLLYSFSITHSNHKYVFQDDQSQSSNYKTINYAS